MPDFDGWFQAATGNRPFSYQRQFAEAGDLPQIVDVPTGCRKTAMVVLAWLWRRRFADEETRETHATPAGVLPAYAGAGPKERKGAGFIFQYRA